MGVIGGGQLARMCQPPAVALGVQLSILAENDKASAALVVPSSPVGDHGDLAAVREFARHCDVVTFDHEQVPTEVLAALEADGVVLQPSPQALVFAQDKLRMRRRLSELGVPCPRWAQVTTREEVLAFGEEVGWPLIVKAPRGGYDGKGVLVAGGIEEVDPWLSEVARDRATVAEQAGGVGASGSPSVPAFADGLLVEEKVDFVRELAVLVARSPSGQATAWPVVETVQVGGVCAEVLAPAPDLTEEVALAATRDALRIAGELGVTGVLAVEMFEVPATSGRGGSRCVVNELAMRPHNSGHWTIEGSVTSQFEQHLRAVLDLPLGDPRPRSRWTVMGNVLGGDYSELYSTYRHLLARDPGLRVHFYGKEVRPGRKVGHVTVCGEDLADLRERARHATEFVTGVITG